MTISQIIAVLSLVATVLTAAASYIGAIDPLYGAVAASVAAGIVAFCKSLSERKPSE